MAAQHPMFGRIARFTAVAGLASGLALTVGASSAQAQFFGGWWGGWRSAEPAPDGMPIPPRRVAGIVASEGFALSAPPRREGDVILADGVDQRGQHMHFVIDAYDGEVIRSRLAGPPRPPGLIGNGEGVDMPPQAHAGLMPQEGGIRSGGPRVITGAGLGSGGPQILGGAQPGLEPPHPLAKPKPAPKPKQTAARTPPKPTSAPVPSKVPSQAEQVKEPALAPTATQQPAASEEAAPAVEAKAPPASAGSPTTPLAPDAAPVHAPRQPGPAATEAKAPVPAATQDIGPSVRKVDPAPTATIPDTPAQSEAPESK